MEEQAANWIIDPVIQKGFAGAAAVLLAVLVGGVWWVLKRCFARLEVRDADVASVMTDYHTVTLRHAVAFEGLVLAIDRSAAANEKTAEKVEETNRLLLQRER